MIPVAPQPEPHAPEYDVASELRRQGRLNPGDA